MNEDTVITVNEKDEVVGCMEKIEAHKKGVLHRAISVFIVNRKGEWLLQQRARSKYHSSLLWSNTCCTHPFPGESNLDAANRRLFEEMGLSATLIKLFSFQYKADLDNNLIENELDHVFMGYSDALPNINKEEVESYRYASSNDLALEIKNSPEIFTAWFKLLFEKVLIKVK